MIQCTMWNTSQGTTNSDINRTRTLFCIAIEKRKNLVYYSRDLPLENHTIEFTQHSVRNE